MRNCLAILLFLRMPVATVAAGPQAASGQAYRVESRIHLDEARLVPAREFEYDALSSVFAQFRATQCEGRLLARLIVAPTDRDLALATNSRSPELNEPAIRKMSLANPALFGPGNASIVNIHSATLLCVGGSATALFRYGTSIRKEVLRGSRDAQTISLAKQTYHWQGFRLDNGVLSVFMRGERLPSSQEAEDLLRYLETILNARVMLTVRTDMFFWYEDGPRFDPYSTAPRISGEEFLRRPYVFCGRSPGRAVCRTLGW